MLYKKFGFKPIKRTTRPNQYKILDFDVYGITPWSHPEKLFTISWYEDTDPERDRWHGYHLEARVDEHVDLYEAGKFANRVLGKIDKPTWNIKPEDVLEVFQRYRIERLILDRREGRLVAIKDLRPEGQSAWRILSAYRQNSPHVWASSKDEAKEKIDNELLDNWQFDDLESNVRKGYEDWKASGYLVESFTSSSPPDVEPIEEIL